MSYIDKNLLAGEQILFRTQLHWVVFILPLVFTLAAILFDKYNPLLEMVAYGGFAVALYFWAFAYVKYLTGDFAVTNKRIIMKLGLVDRRIFETLLQRVESIQVKQSILGRILGYGTVIVCGVGGSKEEFFTISDPIKFRRAVDEQIEGVLNPQ